MTMKTVEMKKTMPRSRPWLLPACAVLLGAVAGSLCGAGVPWLRGLLQSRLAQGSLSALLWPELLLLLALCVSGFLRLGGVWALLALLIKGFLLAAEAAVLASGAEGGAYLTAALPRLLTGFLTLSVLLLLARQSIQLSSRRLRLSPAKARALRPDPPFYLTAGIALAVILGAALLQQKLLGLDLPQLLPEGALRGAGQLGICLPVWSMVKSSR